MYKSRDVGLAIRSCGFSLPRKGEASSGVVHNDTALVHSKQLSASGKEWANSTKRLFFFIRPTNLG